MKSNSFDGCVYSILMFICFCVALYKCDSTVRNSVDGVIREYKSPDTTITIRNGIADTLITIKK